MKFMYFGYFLEDELYVGEFYVGELYVGELYVQMR
jgi:hypothetical protein